MWAWALIRAILIWLLIMAVESVQGMLRRLLFNDQVDFVVRQGSVVIGVLVIFAITWVSMRWMRLRSGFGALYVGALWVALTLAFELQLGRAMGLSWTRILSDYDLAHGGLMPLGLAAMAVTPWLVRRLQSAPAPASFVSGRGDAR